MKWRWNLRPDELKALAAMDQQRIWRHCYWLALRRPRVLFSLIFGSIVVMLGVHLFLWWALDLYDPVAIWLFTIIITIAIVGTVFVRYVTTILRMQLRRITATCCPSCFYDLTGNESGTCPECGTPFATPPSQRGDGNGGDEPRPTSAAPTPPHFPPTA